MSLGALPAQIRNQFLRHGLVLLGAGTVLGIAGAWLTGRAMQSVLYQVPALEATTLAVTAVVMALVSLAACLVPATRAARVDPIIALRGD
jgi:ABC-type antimicrobial peptide transport system permease subunit